MATSPRPHLLLFLDWIALRVVAVRLYHAVKTPLFPFPHQRESISSYLVLISQVLYCLEILDRFFSILPVRIFLKGLILGSCINSWSFEMGFKKELLALAFGVLLILVTFGDNHLGRIVGMPVGNLDSVLGQRYWPVLDVVYPVATIAVFLLHGSLIGKKLKMKSASTVVFVSFIVMLGFMNADDIIIGLNHLGLNLMVYPPQEYWNIISLLYPIYATVAFFLFEQTLKSSRNNLKT
jgi:hypothetical protein